MGTRPTYDYIQDPGHGWLKVPLADLPKGFAPSRFSFRDSRFAYLEEDCDFSAFQKIAPPFDVREVMVESFNRDMRRFGDPEPPRERYISPERLQQMMEESHSDADPGL